MSVRLNTICAVVLAAASVAAPRLARGAEAGGTCHALMVGGHPGSPVYARRYRDWLRRCHSYLTEEAGVPESNVTVISDDEGFRDPMVSGRASPESITEAFDKIAKKARPADQFVLVLVGHGAITTEVPTFVVRGPDPDARLFVRGLEGVRAGSQVVLNFTASSGAFVKHLARAGRVNVAANSATEGIEPVYAEFFLRGLESKRADGAGAPEAGTEDGVVTLLEAFNWATYQAALWISRLHYDGETGGWRVDGAESVEIFEKLCSGPEGALGARRLAPSSRRDAPDEIVRIRPPGSIPDWWTTRRAITEHATLEDCGEEVGVSPLTVVEVPSAPSEPVERAWDVELPEPAPAQWQGDDFKPLAGRKRGEPGHLARRVVLGRAELFTER